MGKPTTTVGSVEGLALYGKHCPKIRKRKHKLSGSATFPTPNFHHRARMLSKLHPCRSTWFKFLPKYPAVSKRNYNSSLLYVDSGAVIVNKPPGLVCQLGDDEQSKTGLKTADGGFKELLTGTHLSASMNYKLIPASSQKFNKHSG